MTHFAGKIIIIIIIIITVIIIMKHLQNANLQHKTRARRAVHAYCLQRALSVMSTVYISPVCPAPPSSVRRRDNSQLTLRFVETSNVPSRPPNEALGSEVDPRNPGGMVKGETFVV